jgi:tRNA threonylcarbamoyl adenosine modification protein YeaZ
MAPTTLVIETSTGRGGVLLSRSLASPTTEAIAVREWSQQNSHTERITADIASCFDELGISPKLLGLIVVNVGPGSFTGLRAGINTAKTLSYTLGAPILAFHSGEILGFAKRRLPSTANSALPSMAAAPDRLRPIAIAINAHAGLFYFAHIAASSEACSDFSIMGRDALAREIQSFRAQSASFVGDGFREFHVELGSAAELSDTTLDTINVQALHLLAQSYTEQREKNRATLDWNQLQPLYLRASSAEEKIRAIEGQGSKA